MKLLKNPVTITTGNGFIIYVPTHLGDPEIIIKSSFEADGTLYERIAIRKPQAEDEIE